MPSRTGKTWDPEEYRKAVHLKNLGLTDAQIGERLGRTEKGVAAKLWVGYRNNHLDRPMTSRPTTGRVAVDPVVLAARAKYQAAQGRRTLTQSLLGDPPPGYSALDRTTRSQELADR